MFANWRKLNQMLINYSLSSPAREWLQCVRWRQKWEHFRTLRSEIFRATIRFIPLITDSGGSIVQKRIKAAEGSDFSLSQKSDFNCQNSDSISYNSFFLSQTVTFFVIILTFSNNSKIFLPKIWLCFSKIWLLF